MSSFTGTVSFILIILIIVLLFLLRIFWDIFATSVTLKLMRNNSGNYSTSRIIIWVFVIIFIALILGILSKKQNDRS